MQQHLLPTRALAAYAVRLLLAAELFLGLACFQRAWFRRLTLPSTFGLLLAFSIYLAYLAFVKKDTASCHCFGELIRMSPLHSLLKNAVLLAIVLYLYWKTRGWPAGAWPVPAGLAAVSLLVVLLGFPVRHIAVQPAAGAHPGEQSRFAEFRRFSPGGDANLTTGTCLVAFVSLDCDHCRDLVSRLGDAARQQLVPPVYLLCLCEGADASAFFAATHADFPYLCVEPNVFFDFIAERPPRLYLLQGGQVRAYWDGAEFDPAQIRAWWRSE